MVNSYAPATIVISPVTAQQAAERYRQGEFLRRNHHLISPWMYTPEQFVARIRALMLMNWDLAARVDTLPSRLHHADEAGTVEDIHGVGYAP